jgi:hypothetical protein
MRAKQGVAGYAMCVLRSKRSPAHNQEGVKSCRTQSLRQVVEVAGIENLETLKPQKGTRGTKDYKA